MSPVRNKRESSKKVPETTENKRLPAYKRQPELYYAHVWLDKEIFTQVLAYIGWEKEQKYSIKAAVRILLQQGLKKYAIEQLALVEKAEMQLRREGREPHDIKQLIKAINLEASKRKRSAGS